MDVEAWRLAARKRVLETGFVCGKKILDIGAGPLALMAAKDFSCKVTSVDTDPAEVEKRREEAAAQEVGGVTFEVADAAKLPYSDRAFEAVVCYGALHHMAVEDREKAVSEMFRVAEEKLVVAEFTLEMIKKEHPEDWQKYELVDLAWLEAKLKKLGVYKKYERETNIYLCMRR